MALFRHLSDDAFLIFGGSNRKLYEECLVRIYNRYFVGPLSFPTQAEVVHEIYDALRDNPGLWTDEETLYALPDLVSKNRRRVRKLKPQVPSGSDFGGGTKKAASMADLALQRARHIYVRLVRCGWLEEERFGLRVTVDMPMGPMLLLETLSSLRAGVSTRLGGVVTQIRASLVSLRERPSDSALALRQSREDSERFARSLRAILSSLKTIQKSIMGSKSRAERLETIFDDFIGQLVLKDFSSLYTVNDPLRHRGEILNLIQDLSFDRPALEAIGAVYHENGLAVSPQEGALDAEGDLIAIEQIFSQIGEMCDRIDSFRKQLEQRLRNTVSYAERGRNGFAERAQELLYRVDRLLDRDRADAMDPLVEGVLQPIFSPWADHLQAQPREPREAVKTSEIRPRLKNRAMQIYKAMREAYADRVNPKPEAVRRFLEKQVPPFGRTEARWIKIDSVDDFIAFDAVRRALHAGNPAITEHFALTPLGPDAAPHDSDWITCENFEIRRLGDDVAPEPEAPAIAAPDRATLEA
jgi:hypothetical protein